MSRIELGLVAIAVPLLVVSACTSIVGGFDFNGKSSSGLGGSSGAGVDQSTGNPTTGTPSATGTGGSKPATSSGTSASMGGASSAGGGSSSSGGTNDSFATAQPVTVGMTTTTTLGNAMTAIQYYSFMGTKNERIAITTMTPGSMATPNDPSILDTVVTLFDSTKTQIAQDDDAWPRPNSDSQLFTMLPEDGTYYFTVGSCFALLGAANCYSPGGVTQLGYSVTVSSTSTLSVPETNAMANTSDGTAAAVPFPTMGSEAAGLLDGAFDTSTTRDFQFSAKMVPLSGGARERVYFRVQPVGSKNGDGSISPATFSLVNPVTMQPVASADESNYDNGDDLMNGALLLSAPVTPGTQYFLNVNAKGVQAQSFFFVVAAIEGGSGQVEVEPNNTMTTANNVTALGGSSFAIDGDLASVADIDWFEFDLPTAASSAEIACAGQRTGSGLTGLTAELYSATSQMLQAIGPETATTDLYNDAIAIAAPGTKFYLSVKATGLNQSVGGPSYTCTLGFQ